MNMKDVRTLLLTSAGGALEFYDFVIFVFFTSVIAKVFFPPSMPEWLRQAQTFGIFAAGYFARPLGGVVLAHFGDRRGRKRVFAVSVLLMALPTLAIGFLPTYQSAGAAAPLLLLLMRIVQGAAIGGEIPGAWVFLAEHAQDRRPGLAIGILTGGLTMGLLLGSLTAISLQLYLGPALIIGGGWRIPFLAGGLLGMVTVVLRRWLSETAIFAAVREQGRLSREIPLRVVFRDHLRSFIASFLSTCMLSSAIVVILLMTPTLLAKSLGVATESTLWANMAATAASVCFLIVFGAAVDRFGLRQVGFPALLFMIGATYALYLGARWNPALLVPLYAVAGAAAGAVVLTPLMMVRLFPAAVRFSGVSASYNIAYSISGGLAPALVPWLAHRDPMSPAHYVAVTALLGVLSLVVAPQGAQIQV
jgi:MFS family permease